MPTSERVRQTLQDFYDDGIFEKIHCVECDDYTHPFAWDDDGNRAFCYRCCREEYGQ